MIASPRVAPYYHGCPCWHDLTVSYTNTRVYLLVCVCVCVCLCVCACVHTFCVFVCVCLPFQGDGHNIADLLVYDTTQEAVSELFIHACFDLTSTGYVDGCFVDRPVDGAPSSKISATRQQELLLSHVTTLQKFQSLLKRGPLIANHAYSMPGVNSVMIEGFAANEASIQELQWCAKRGKLTEAHMRGGNCNSDEGIQDHLAAFLIGAGEYSYFGCGPWYSPATSVATQWKASYDKPLGAPIGLAVNNGGIYTRKFASGTSVQFDTKTNKGHITWAD